MSIVKKIIDLIKEIGNGLINPPVVSKKVSST